jgi:hypothetical protein
VEEAMKKQPPIPKSDSIRELAEFWETHDFTDYEDQMVRVEEPVFEKGKSVKVRLGSKAKKIVKGIAHAKGVKEADVIQEWIREKIQAS